MNLQESIRRILREELSPRVRRRISYDEMEKEFLESFEYAYDLTKKRKVFSTHFLDELIYSTITTMMDGIHWRFVSTLPEDEFWYDDIHTELENHYRDRIIQMYNERRGIKESILREDEQKKDSHKYLKTILNNHIDRHGIYHTSKITGLSITKIIEMSNFPINSEIANDILIDNLNKGKLKDTYKEFNIQSNLDGVVYWDGEIKTGEFLPNYTEVITAMATPFWDGIDYTPVEIDWITLEDRSRKIGKQVVVEISGEGDYFKVLQDKTRFDSVEELFSWYDEVYLPGVYDIIINKLLPIAQQDIQDKMDDDMIF